MASHEEPAGPRLGPPPVTVDAESGSSYAGSASSAPATPSCPYRDLRFHDQECSRYFDCPTHILRRDGTGAVGPEDPSRGAEGIPTTWDPELAGIQTPQRPPSQQRDDGSTAAPSAQAQAQSPGNAAASSSSLPLRPASQQRATGTGAMTLMEALHDTRTPSSPAQTVDTEVAPAQISSPRQPSSASLRGLRPTSSRSSLGGNDPEFPPAQHPVQGPAAQPARWPSQSRAAPDFALPRWQPDAEVTFCPICRTQFSIFVRKHHCRKCGRVVCASCSPHRITIPHQYIVRAPGEALGILRGIWGDELVVPGVDVSQLGGGERVRLCNPCVPDPNTTPPQALNSPGISQFAGRSPHQRSQSSNSIASNLNPERMPSMPANYRPYYAPAAWNEANARTRSVTMNADNHSRPRTGFNNASNRILAGTPPVYYSHDAAFDYTSSHRLPPFTARYPQSGHRSGGAEASSSRQAQFLRYGHDAASSPSSSSAAAINNRPLPAPPQIPEEDECPVCHRELPSRDLPNFEAVREAHINSCIAAHSTYTPAPTVPGQPGAQGSPPPRAVRRTGMFPYLATEKDCVDSAECTICLEEFEAGVRMARLECLCRFHHACISAWFINHPGRCPVHQHDSLGY